MGTGTPASRTNAMKVVVVTEKPFAAPAVQAIKSALTGAGHDVAFVEKYKEKQQVLSAIGDAQALIVRSDKIDSAVLAAAPQLKIIVRAGAGVDSIDLEACTARNVVVMNTPGQNSNAVAELAFGMMIRHARNNYDGSSGREVRGKSLGLYGLGWVPVYMNKIAQALGMNVVAFDPYISDAKLKE